MRKRHSARWWVAVSAMIFGPVIAFAQNYPNKPIRIVTGGAGSGTDFTARLIAQGMSGALGQRVIVDNRVTIIAIETVASAMPDGYTLLVGANTLWIGPLLRKVSYDPIFHFSPVTLVTSAPSILIVYPSLPAKSVQEVIDLAKGSPGALNYSAGISGSTAQLAMELFNAMVGIKMTRIPYKSGSAEIAALISGEVKISFSSAAAAMPHTKSGKLRALAVTSAEPSALFPDLPTVAATVPGYVATSLTGLFAPAKTPMALVDQLNHEIVRFLKTTDAKEKFFNSGVEIVGSSSEEAASKIKSEVARMGEVIKKAGIKDD